jgi:hypothetical protein
MKPGKTNNGSFFIARLLGGLLFAWPALAGHSGTVAPLQHMSMRTLNYAAIPEAILAKAETAAADILRRAGVQITWLNCPASEWESEHPCNQDMAPTDFWMRVVPDNARSHGVLGNSILAGTAGASKYATVMFKPLDDIQKRSRIDVYEILGAVMAHEIGHLLMGPIHTQNGVMSTNWSDEQFRCISRGELNFTLDQAENLRIEIAGLQRSKTPSSPLAFIPRVDGF